MPLNKCMPNKIVFFYVSFLVGTIVFKFNLLLHMAFIIANNVVTEYH